MSERKNWTRDELALALNLYCKLPFGKMDHRNPDVITLADYIGRTPSAVAMKLGNFAALDSSLTQKGLSSYSKLDREVWNEFFANETIILNTEETMERIASDNNTEQYEADDIIITGKARLRQGFFRNSIMANYDWQCCITGIAIPEILIASHIVPWRTDKRNRLNPQNGLCLNALHDQAFDKGFISIDNGMRIMISKFIPRKKTYAFLLDFEGKAMTLPKKFHPSSEFLQYHREHIFRS